MINRIRIVYELEIITTCSFDCSASMWKKSTLKKCGSLQLGTGALQKPSTDEDRMKLAKVWQLNQKVRDLKLK
jgi:hypothetical protein